MNINGLSVYPAEMKAAHCHEANTQMDVLDHVLYGIQARGWTASLEYPGFITAQNDNGGTMNFGFANGSFGWSDEHGNGAELDGSNDSSPVEDLIVWATVQLKGDAQ